jgi:hypothetical protein
MDIEINVHLIPPHPNWPTAEYYSLPGDLYQECLAFLASGHTLNLDFYDALVETRELLRGLIPHESPWAHEAAIHELDEQQRRLLLAHCIRNQYEQYQVEPLAPSSPIALHLP